MITPSFRSRHAVVIGAGIAGLAAARALSETFDQVTVVERDHLPATPVPRPGVPQGGTRMGSRLAAGRCWRPSSPGSAGNWRPRVLRTSD